MYKSRVIFVLFFIAGLWGAMILRGAYLQLMPNPQFEKIKERQFSRMIKLNSRRGDILDRHGKELAVSVTSYSLFADPKIIEDPYATAKKLARHFRVSFRSMYKKVKNNKRRFVWIRRRLNPQDYKKIKAWNIRGLAFKEEFKRIYPNKNLAANVLGFVGREQQGLDGLEKKYESFLSGAGKKVSVQRDARGRALVEDGRLFARPPEGSDIYLTIDKDLQYWVEDQLAKAVEEHAAESAWAVVLDPKDSAILAMANHPSYDPNRPLKVSSQLRRNKAIHDVYETGSVIKAFSVGGALDKGIVEPNTKINTENGVFHIGGRKIKEADKKHYFKELTVSEIISYSSNVGTSKIALMMTDTVLYQTLLDFGFGAKSGVGLLGEAKGLLSKPPWRDHLTANISFGHGIAVTALQVANAYAVIANGGELNRPYIVKEIRDLQKGEVIKTDKRVIRRVVSEKNASLLKMMLSSVVSEGGTGYKARIHGYPIAGKTGTAQKVNPEGRGYLPGHYIASFAGFVPANNPKYVIYVAVDSPKKHGYYATTVAAPIFRNIAEFALRRDGSAPVYLSDQDMVHQQQLQSAENSEQKVLRMALEDIPPELPQLPQVPQLKGLTLRELYQELHGYDLKIDVLGDGRVVSTWPQAGAPLRNKSIKVVLRRPEKEE
jgi:cell division protein FtsI (penicillin-binding protein 3)